VIHRMGIRGAALAAAALLAVATPGTGRAQQGDAEAGRGAFNRVCAACHAVAAGQNKVGPSLHGVVGREAGKAPNFNYSPAIRESGKTWDAATLNAYLENPRTYIPGNRMILAGVRSEQDRQNIVAYLAQQK
jgi:cytochrome c